MMTRNRNSWKQTSLIGVAALCFIFTSCTSGLTEEEKEVYVQKGNEISQAAFHELSTNLMAQMKEGGPQQAIPFCNENALVLTEMLSEEHHATIKRTSDKIRNSANSPSKRELEVIAAFKKNAEEAPLAPIVEKDADNTIHYYAPIKTLGACLNCHGEVGSTMKSETNTLVKSMYAEDLAIGYKEGELRGIWSISFKE